jgi:iron complex outermembrane receptor protein
LGSRWPSSAARSQTTTASAQSAENPTIETVVISAQKRPEAERAQNVPLSLTVVNNVGSGGAPHTEPSKSDHNGAQRYAAQPVRGYATFAIRGLGVNTTIPSMEPAVGVFVDGIYLGTNAASVVDVIDVENVEILRGPQGLLFGRNTTGGAVLVNSRRPGDNFAVYGAVNYETGPQETVLASIEGPLGTKFRAKVTGYYDNDTGWFTNRFDGSKFGASRDYVVRPILMWTPDPTFDTTLIYERGSRRGDGPVAQNPAFFDGFTIDLNYRGYDHTDWQSVTVESNWRAAGGVFTSLAGYRTLDQALSIDNDGGPNPAFVLSAQLRQHQFSEELRYSGQIFDRLDLTAGLYYFTQSYMYLERRVLFGATIDSSLGGHVDADNYAAFAQLDYAVTSELTLIAGGRFTDEKKDVKIAYLRPFYGAFTLQLCGGNLRLQFPRSGFPNAPGSKTWDNFTPQAWLPMAQ